MGHYQTGSISVRILSFEDEPIDRDFYLQRLTEAYRLRLKADLIRPDNTIYRLVYGEGDNMPGLIIDMYGNTAVVQVHTVGMNRDRRLIVEALQEVIPSHAIEHIFYKSEATLAYTGDREFRDGYLMGGDKVNPVAVENRLKFHIDWLRGQKTGFSLISGKTENWWSDMHKIVVSSTCFVIRVDFRLMLCEAVHEKSIR